MGGRWAHRNQKWNQTFNEFALTRLKAATQSLAIVQSLDHPCNKNPRVFFHPLSYFPLWITHFIEAFPSTLRRNSKNRIQNFPSVSPLHSAQKMFPVESISKSPQELSSSSIRVRPAVSVTKKIPRDIALWKVTWKIYYFRETV